KITGRTLAPGAYVLAEYGLLVSALVMVGINVYDRHWLSAGFALTYAVACTYAIFGFIGWRDGMEDLRLWLRRPAMPKPARQVADGSPRTLPLSAHAYPPVSQQVIQLSGRRSVRASA